MLNPNKPYHPPKTAIHTPKLYKATPPRVGTAGKMVFAADGQAPSPDDDAGEDLESQNIDDLIEQDMARNATGPPAAGAFLPSGAFADDSTPYYLQRPPDDGPPQPDQPTPSQADASIPLPPPPNAPPVPIDPQSQQLMQLASQRDQILKNLPVKGPTPWWAQLAARGLGAAAGWSNAASRTRNPINVGQLQENVMHPLYAEHMAEAESKLAPVQAQIQQILGQRQAGLQAQDTAAQIEQRLGQAARSFGQGDYYHSRAQGDFVVDAKQGVVFNRRTGQTTPIGGNNPEMIRQRVLQVTNDPDAANFAYTKALTGTGYKPNSPFQAIGPNGLLNRTTGQVMAPPPNPDKEAAAEDRRLRLTLEQQNAEDRRTNQQIQRGREGNEWKVGKEQAILDEYRKNVGQLRGQHGGVIKEEEVAPIRAATAARLQSIQNTYEQNVRAAGGTAEHWNVTMDPKTDQPVYVKVAPPAGNRPPLGSFFGRQ